VRSVWQSSTTDCDELSPSPPMSGQLPQLFVARETRQKTTVFGTIVWSARARDCGAPSGGIAAVHMGHFEAMREPINIIRVIEPSRIWRALRSNRSMQLGP